MSRCRALALVFAVSCMAVFHGMTDRERIEAVPMPPSESPNRVAPTSARQGLVTDVTPGETRANLRSDNASHSFAPMLGFVINGRALMEKSWSQPEKGGRYYASYLIEKCSSVARGTDLLSSAQPDERLIKPEEYGLASRALVHLQLTCGQFDEQDYVSFGRVAARAHPAGDPLMDASKQLLDASGQEDSKESRSLRISTLVNTQGPLLWDEYGLRALLRREGSVTSIVFDEVKYAVNDNLPIAGALYLLPCLLGHPCDGADLDLIVACLSGAGCFADRRAKVLHVHSGGDAAKYQEAERLAEVLAAAVRGGRVERFGVRQ